MSVRVYHTEQQRQPCLLCKGRGTITQEQRERYEAGQRELEEARKQGLTVSQYALSLGISGREMMLRFWGIEEE